MNFMDRRYFPNWTYTGMAKSELWFDVYCFVDNENNRYCAIKTKDEAWYWAHLR